MISSLCSPNPNNQTSHMVNKTQISVSVTDKQLRKIDVDRGITARSTYVRHLIDACLKER